MAIENIVQAKVTGFGNDRVRSEKFTETRTPTEVFEGYAVVGNTSVNLDIGGIANSLVQGLWIKAESGNCFLLANHSVAAAVVSVSGLFIPEGAVNLLTFNSTVGVNDTLGNIKTKGSASTAAISYIVYGTAT
jgi:hypothetical protein